MKVIDSQVYKQSELYISSLLAVKFIVDFYLHDCIYKILFGHLQVEHWPVNHCLSSLQSEFYISSLLAAEFIVRLLSTCIHKILFGHLQVKFWPANHVVHKCLRKRHDF